MGLVFPKGRTHFKCLKIMIKAESTIGLDAVIIIKFEAVDTVVDTVILSSGRGKQEGQELKVYPGLHSESQANLCTRDSSLVNT